jgi:hypothetical protein
MDLCGWLEELKVLLFVLFCLALHGMFGVWVDATMHSTCGWVYKISTGKRNALSFFILFLKFIK